MRPNLWQFLMLSQFWSYLNPFLDWFQIDSNKTKLIQTIVLIVQLWIDFGSILTEVSI
jgi:hypothetical protein